MTTILAVRKSLGLTQSELAKRLGVTQGSVSFYENGQTIPPETAAKLIVMAKEAGHVVTFDDIYAPQIEPKVA
jgi:putative transcriptional regulator